VGVAADSTLAVSLREGVAKKDTSINPDSHVVKYQENILKIF
jgi:hypothetical protein